MHLLPYPNPSRIVAAVALVCFSVSGASPMRALAEAAPPNIVFIMADDLGFGDLGVTGQLARAAANLPAIATPHIDQLAAQGTRYTQMYAGAPICSPSRVSLLTGFDMQYIIRENVDESASLRAGSVEDRTWGQMLQDAGYATGMWGKWHVGGVGNSSTGEIFDYGAIPTQKGFETAFGTMGGGYRPNRMWEDDGLGGLKKVPNPFLPGQWPGPGHSYKYSEDTTVEHAVDYVRSHANQAQPFAMYYAANAPHTPLDWYGENEYANEPWPDQHRHYASMISQLDRHVGMIIDALEDPNNDGDASDSVMSNTMVVFTSDNGPLWDAGAPGFTTEFFDSNGPYRGQKSNLFEGGSRVPFIVRWDGEVAAGGVNNQYVGTFADMYATFAELAGQDTPVGLDGRSMVSALRGDAVEARRDGIVFTSFQDFAGLDQSGYAIRLGDWKLIRRIRTGTVQLYDLAADPSESTNLAVSRPDIVSALTSVAELQGVVEEPRYDTLDTSQGLNVYFTQYKTWAPLSTPSNFNVADNWAGGTQRGRPTDPDALYWNTAPASNWIAKVENNTPDSFRNAWLSDEATVLALEIVGTTGVMQVNLTPGSQLNAYNGVRVSAGGVMRLIGATVTTADDIDVRPGGKLVGSGLVRGWSSLIDAIPELSGQGLLEPQVVNHGIVEVYGGFDPAAVGSLTIDGDFAQLAGGELKLDLFNGAGVAGSSNDFVDVDGAATLAGTISLQLMAGFSAMSGQQFTLLSAASLVNEGLRLGGPHGRLFGLAVTGGTDLTATYLGGDFDGNGAINGIDLGYWETNFGGLGPNGDANHDDLVNGRDFLAWQRQFGVTSPQLAAVPEPASVVLAATAAALAVLRRRRLPIA